jgi:hypothetical protein
MIQTKTRKFVNYIQILPFYLLMWIGFVNSSSAQTPFWSDSFESVGSPSSGIRTPSTNFACNTPNSSYFKIATNADLSLVLTNGQTNYSNIDGTQFWAGEDLDAGSTCTNNSQSNTQTITWTGINISGRTNIQFKGLFGAHNPFPSGSVWDNFPGSIDYLWIEYRIDGGAWNRIISFYGDIAGSSGSLTLDTDNDLAGDGLKLSKIFQELTANITGTGTTLELRFTASANGLVTEEFAIDNFRLVENLPSAVISSTGTLSGLTTTYGTASSNTSFSVSGTSMTAGITVTPPAGFEVSLSAVSGFSNSIVIGSAGTIPSTTVYVRLAATTVPNSYSGNIVLSSSGATSVNVATVLSTVNPKPLTITGVIVNNKIYDGNTTATLSGTPTLSGGLVGSDIVTLNSGGASGTFSNKNVGNNKPVNITGYSLSGAQASYYTLSQPTGLTANITAKGLTISGITVNNKIYDGNTTATLSGTPSLVGVVMSDVVSLTGSPTATFASPNAGTAIAVTITGYNLTGTDAGNYTLSQPTGLTANITALLSPAAGVLPAGVVGISYTQTINQTGIVSAVTWSVSAGALPTGLSLNTSTGEISGTPTTTVGSPFNFTIQASGGVCCVGSQVYTIAISCPTITFVNTVAPNGTVGSAYNFDASVTGNTATITYSVSPALPAGLSLNTSTGQITGTPTAQVAATAYTVTASQSSGVCTATQNYTFAVACPTITIAPAAGALTAGTIGSTYSVGITQTGLTGTPAWSISAGTLPAGLNIAGGTGIISGIPTATGTFNFTVQVTNGTCSQTQAYSIVVSCPTITFTNTTASGATVGNPYNLDASVTGNTQAITYSVSPALPTGLSLNTSTGQITGIPTIQTASTTYTVTASQSSGVCTTTQNYTFAVTCPFTFTPSTLPNTTVGTTYSQTITQTGLSGSVTWSVSIGSLPSGLSLNSSTGQITGNPTATGTFNFTIQATDGACTVSLGYSIVVSCPTITFTNTVAPNGTVGSAYNLDASVTGNTQAITYSVAPALPAGLSLNTSTGAITGTPTAITASATYTVTASQSSGVCTATQNYTFAVTCPTITITPAAGALTAGTIGSAYSVTISQTGLSGTPAWSISAGALPGGLSIAGGTGIISGTPTATGTFNFTVQVTDGTCTQTQVYSIVVSCPTITFVNTVAPNGTVGSAYNFDASVTGNTQAITYSVSPALPAGLSLNTSTGQISGTPTAQVAATAYTVTASQSSGVCTATQIYTFSVNCAGITISPVAGTLAAGTIGTAYSVTISQTGLAGTPAWSISTGALPGGLSINTTSGEISGTPTATGTFNFTVQVTDGTCTASQAYSIVVSCPTIVFVNASATNATIGSAYNLNASVTGNTQTITYSVSPALPAGLSLNTSTGQITGTPTAVTASATYTVTASQSSGVCTVTQNYTFAVACPTITFVNTTANNATVGVSYNLDASVTGSTATVTYSVSPALPAGLSLNTSTGQITGTPTATAVSTTYTVTASQSGGVCTVTQNYTFAVNCAGVSISPTTLPNGFLSTAYSQTLTQTGLSGTPAWSVSVGALPTGLSLNATSGAITGTPTALGTFNFTVEVTDGTCSTSQAYTVVISCTGVSVNPATLPNATQLVAYSQTLTQTGLSGTITWSVSAGTLPTGLTLNASSGVISGTPSALGTFNFTVQATDGTCSATRAYTIVVSPSGPIIQITVTDIDFGDVLILQSSRKTITVRNIGAGPLSLSSMSMPNVVFNYGFIGTISIAPNESREFEVSFTPTAVASYSGTVTINSNAVAGVNTFTVRGNGINPTALNTNKGVGLNAYPNPTADKVNISVENAWIGEYSVSVKDVLGKEVMIQKSNSSVFQIDLTSLPSGLYLVQVSHKNGTKTIQIAKK